MTINLVKTQIFVVFVVCTGSLHCILTQKLNVGFHVLFEIHRLAKHLFLLMQSGFYVTHYFCANVADRLFPVATATRCLAEQELIL